MNASHNRKSTGCLPRQRSCGESNRKVKVDIVDEQNTRVIPGKLSYELKATVLYQHTNEDEASRKAFIDGYFFPGDREVSTTMACSTSKEEATE